MAENFSNFRSKLLNIFFLFSIVGLIVISRQIPLDHSNLFNCSPTLAIFLFCGAYLRGVWAWLTPVCSIVISDFCLSGSYDLNYFEPFMLITLLSYTMLWFTGYKLGKNCSLLSWVAGAVLGALAFYTITSTFAWAINPAYAKNASGWVHALIIGEPGFAPAYLFLRNSILSTLFFSVCFRTAFSLFFATQSKGSIISQATET